jgi:hypothetical protein
MINKYLVSKAQKQITQLIIDIEAAKLDPFVWDKERPWLNRREDGRFGNGGTASIESDLHKFLDFLENQLNVVTEKLKTIPQEVLEKIKSLTEGPDVQKIRQNTKKELTTIDKALGIAYQKSVDITNSIKHSEIYKNIKFEIDFTRQSLKNRSLVSKGLTAFNLSGAIAVAMALTYMGQVWLGLLIAIPSILGNLMFEPSIFVYPWYNKGWTIEVDTLPFTQILKGITDRQKAKKVAKALEEEANNTISTIKEKFNEKNNTRIS